MDNGTQVYDTQISGFVKTEGGKVVTLGKHIQQARKQNGLSQKQLAAQVKKEDGSPISPQYLNDIEHDRRVPSPHVIRQIANVLQENEEYLLFLADKWPEDLQENPPNQEEFRTAWALFRRQLSDHRRGGKS